MQNKNPKKKLGIYTLNIGVIRKLVKNGGPGIAQIPVFGEGTVFRAEYADKNHGGLHSERV